MAEALVGGDRRTFELIRRLNEARAREDAARAERVAIEEEVITATGFGKSEGSQTYGVTIDGVGSTKFTMKQPVRSSVQQGEIPNVKRQMGKAAFEKAFRTKYEVNSSGLKALERENRDLYLLACEAIVKTPGKVAVEVKNLVVT